MENTNNPPRFKNQADLARWYLAKFSYQEIKNMRWGEWLSFYRVIEKFGWHTLKWVRPEERPKLQLIQDFLTWAIKENARREKEQKKAAKNRGQEMQGKLF